MFRRRLRCGGVAVAVGTPVAVEAQLLDELRGDLGGVLALGIAGAAEEFAAAAGADDHGLAAVFAVDVGGDVLELPVAAGGGDGVVADDLGDELAGLGGVFLEQRDQRLDLLDL